MNTLKNKIALITGGTSGMGAATAKRFHEEGATVIVTGSSPATVEAARKAMPYVEAVVSDAGDPKAAEALVNRVKENHGRIDVLFVNAGFYEFAKFGEITEEHFDNTFDTNVRGLLFAVQKALPLLSRNASVILNGSIASIRGIPSFSVYNATKAAVRSFARSWIVDLKGTGIRVNVLSPGHTDTPGLSRLLTDGQKAGAVATVPLDRLGTSDDLGLAAVFLASDDSAYVTGIELFVDGGAGQI
jgi:NAD(P)-dependent dehydrogenase (short-subunit alcohol dehydrogenase family)